jgi:hypothetical protein
MRATPTWKDWHLPPTRGGAAPDQADYDARMERTLDELRRDLGIEVDLLRAYYAIERRRYPAAPESPRLLD